MKKIFEKKYIITIGIAVIVFFCTMGFIFYSFFTTINDKIIHIGKSSASESVKTVNAYLEENVDIVTLCSESVDYMLKNKASNKEIQEYLVNTTKGYVESIGSEFTGFYGVIRGEYLSGAERKTDIEKAPEKSEWYQKAVSGKGKTVIATPYIDHQTGQVMISISRVLSDGKSVIGISISLEKLNNLAKKIKESGVGYCVIMDDKGLVVAGSNRNEIGKNYYAGDAGDEKRSMAKTAYSKSEIHFSTRLGMMAGIAFSNKMYSNWRVILIMDESVVYEGLTKNLMLCAAVSIILLVVMLYFCINSNTKRIFAENTADQLSAAAGIYMSMHVLNIETGTFKELNSMDHVTGLAVKQATNAQDALRRAMIQLTDEQYIEDMLKFIDLSTLADRINDKKTITFEFLDQRNSWCRGRFIVIDYQSNGEIRRVLWAVENIDAEKRKENHLLYLSETDLMTGIRNRGSGEKKIKELLNIGKTGMFCLLDADDFKSINDNYGHDIGDKVIMAIAEKLKNSFRDNDIVMRMGGDEYAAFAVGVTNCEAAERVLERFFSNIESIDIPELKERKISVSLGAAFYDPAEEIGFEELYRRADSCTYESKKVSGNKYTLYQ